jgi:preprotein translocase subunit SecY
MVSMGMINPSRLGLPEPASPLFLGSPSVFVFVTTVVLTCTTMVFMWMGEQVTERGIGNGVSIIITINMRFIIKKCPMRT